MRKVVLVTIIHTFRSYHADDADFTTQELEKKDNLQKNIKSILSRENLKVNETKTEETVLERKKKVQKYSCEIKDDLKMNIKRNEIESWRTTKKLGSLLGVREDINRRKQLATVALNKINNIWIRKDKIKQSLRLKLYKSIIKPILIYNSGTWSPTKKEDDDLNAFHHKQIRKVMNIKYPVIMRNSVVYRESGEEMLSLEVMKNRWKLFGHVLRSNEETPAQKAMKFYFTDSDAERFRGRSRVNVPWKLNDDLMKFTSRMNLKTNEDLQILKVLAKDRKKWKGLIDEIYEAAKAEKNLIFNYGF